MAEEHTTPKQAPPPSDIPRFVLSLTDTHTTLYGDGAERNLNIAIAAEKLSDFVKFIPKRNRKEGNRGRNEFEAMMVWFAEQVAIADNDKAASKVEFDDQGKSEPEA